MTRVFYAEDLVQRYAVDFLVDFRHTPHLLSSNMYDKTK